VGGHAVKAHTLSPLPAVGPRRVPDAASSGPTLKAPGSAGGYLLLHTAQSPLNVKEDGRRAIKSAQLIWSTCTVALRNLHGDIHRPAGRVVDPTKFDSSSISKRKNARCRPTWAVAEEGDPAKLDFRCGSCVTSIAGPYGGA
jgi:hypothetical protein